MGQFGDLLYCIYLVLLLVGTLFYRLICGLIAVVGLCCTTSSALEAGTAEPDVADPVTAPEIEQNDTAPPPLQSAPSLPYVPHLEEVREHRKRMDAKQRQHWDAEKAAKQKEEREKQASMWAYEAYVLGPHDDGFDDMPVRKQRRGVAKAGEPARIAPSPSSLTSFKPAGPVSIKRATATSSSASSLPGSTPDSSSPPVSNGTESLAAPAPTTDTASSPAPEALETNKEVEVAGPATLNELQGAEGLTAPKQVEETPAPATPSTSRPSTPDAAPVPIASQGLEGTLKAQVTPTPVELEAPPAPKGRTRVNSGSSGKGSPSNSHCGCESTRSLSPINGNRVSKKRSEKTQRSPAEILKNTLEDVGGAKKFIPAMEEIANFPGRSLSIEVLVKLVVVVEMNVSPLPTEDECAVEENTNMIEIDEDDDGLIEEKFDPTMDDLTVLIKKLKIHVKDMTMSDTEGTKTKSNPPPPSIPQKKTTDADRMEHEQTPPSALQQDAVDNDKIDHEQSPPSYSPADMQNSTGVAQTDVTSTRNVEVDMQAADQQQTPPAAPSVAESSDADSMAMDTQPTPPIDQNAPKKTFTVNQFPPNPSYSFTTTQQPGDDRPARGNKPTAEEEAKPLFDVQKSGFAEAASEAARIERELFSQAISTAASPQNGRANSNSSLGSLLPASKSPGEATQADEGGRTYRYHNAPTAAEEAKPLFDDQLPGFAEAASKAKDAHLKIPAKPSTTAPSPQSGHANDSRATGASTMPGSTTTAPASNVQAQASSNAQAPQMPLASNSTATAQSNPSDLPGMLEQLKGMNSLPGLPDAYQQPNAGLNAPATSSVPSASMTGSTGTLSSQAAASMMSASAGVSQASSSAPSTLNTSGSTAGFRFPGVDRRTDSAAPNNGPSIAGNSASGNNFPNVTSTSSMEPSTIGSSAQQEQPAPPHHAGQTPNIPSTTTPRLKPKGLALPPADASRNLQARIADVDIWKLAQQNAAQTANAPKIATPSTIGKHASPSPSASNNAPATGSASGRQLSQQKPAPKPNVNKNANTDAPTATEEFSGSSNEKLTEPLKQGYFSVGMDKAKRIIIEWARETEKVMDRIEKDAWEEAEMESDSAVSMGNAVDVAVIEQLKLRGWQVVYNDQLYAEELSLVSSEFYGKGSGDTSVGASTILSFLEKLKPMGPQVCEQIVAHTLKETPLRLWADLTAEGEDFGERYNLDSSLEMIFSDVAGPLDKLDKFVKNILSTSSTSDTMSAPGTAGGASGSSPPSNSPAPAPGTNGSSSASGSSVSAGSSKSSSRSSPTASGSSNTTASNSPASDSESKTTSDWAQTTEDLKKGLGPAPQLTVPEAVSRINEWIEETNSKIDMIQTTAEKKINDEKGRSTLERRTGGEQYKQFLEQDGWLQVFNNQTYMNAVDYMAKNRTGTGPDNSRGAATILAFLRKCKTSKPSTYSDIVSRTFKAKGQDEFVNEWCDVLQDGARLATPLGMDHGRLFARALDIMGDLAEFLEK